MLKTDEDEPVYSEALRRSIPVVRPLTDIDRFLRLKPTKQRDILMKWLKFYQKMLPRRDYSRFLVDFEQSLHKNLLNEHENSPSTRHKTSETEFHHRRILFECMKRIKPQIITNCNEKYLLRRNELNSQYSNIIWDLINDNCTYLVLGCRSKRLEETLNDLLFLEEGGHVDVEGQPRQTDSYTSILHNLENNVPATNINNSDLLSDIPEIENGEFAEQILNDMDTLNGIPILDISDLQEFNSDASQSPCSRGDAISTTQYLSEKLAPCELIEAKIRDILHQEAVEAFIRSNESATKSCCDLDSPSCILSTWIAAEYHSLPNVSTPQTDHSHSHNDSE